MFEKLLISCWKLDDPAGCGAVIGVIGTTGASPERSQHPASHNRLMIPGSYMHVWTIHTAQKQEEAVSEDLVTPREAALRGYRRANLIDGRPLCVMTLLVYSCK